MKKEKTTITLEKSTKEKAIKIANEMGISLSAYITIIVNKAVRENEKNN